MGTVVSVERVRAREHGPGRVSDEALVARVRAGDERAFEELYARYRDRLHRYCASILRQPEDAEEAVQSAMLGAYRALAGSDVRALAVRPWLYRIAHNQCIGMLRHRAARPTEPLTGLEVLPSQDVAERVETADELGRLRQDILSLPPEQRAALVLRELSGLSHEQIGLVLDETPATVKQLIYQARLGLHAMADGHALGCDTVRRRISDGDGRVLRSRGMGAHLRTCPTCRAFREGLAVRPAKLAALVPVVPLALGRDLIGAVELGGGVAGGAGAGAVGGFSLAGGGLALKLALVVTAGIVGASAVVAPRVIGETARPEPRVAASAQRPAVPFLAGDASVPAVAARTVAAVLPPEVDAPLVLDIAPPSSVPVGPPAAPPGAGQGGPAAAGPVAASAPAPGAATTTAAPAAAAAGTTARARGGGGGASDGSATGTPPGRSRARQDAPGHSGDAPGNGAPASAPGRSGDAPGHSGDAPGNGRPRLGARALRGRPGPLRRCARQRTPRRGAGPLAGGPCAVRLGGPRAGRGLLRR